MALTKTQVSQLYVSVFGRASEGEGNTYWQTDAASTSMTAAADIMLATDPAKTYFGDTLNDNQKFIEHIYKNTLGKTYDQDKEGVDYWVAELAGGKSKGEVVAALIEAAQATANAGDAQDQFNNKVAVSDYTADTISKFTQIDDFTAFISGVTHEASTVTTAKAAVDEAKPAVEGDTFALTTSADLVTGTANDDTMTGYVGTNAANGELADTFQSVDVIDGGAGNDTLSVSSNTAEANIGATMNSVENLVFTAYKGGTAGTAGKANLNLSNTTGLESLTNKNSIATFSVESAKAMDVGVTNVNGKVTDLNFLSTAYTGLTDSATLTLNNATNQAKVVYTGAGGAIETLNVKTTGAASKVDLGGTLLDGTTKMVVTGDQNFSFDDTDGTTAMAKLKTLDASGLTGTLDADLSNGGAVDLAITGTAKDDTVKIVNFTKDDVVDLGEGADKLSITTAASVTAAAKLANIETLAFTPGGNHSVNLAGATELTTIALGASASTLQFTKAVSTAQTIAFNGGGVAADTALTGVGFALGTSTGTSDKLALTYTNTDANGNLINTTKGAQLTSAVTANGIETIEISTDKLHADTKDTTAKTSDGGLKVTLSADKVQTLKITSETLVDTTGAKLDSTIKTVDASAANGGVKLDLTDAADATSVAGGATGSVNVTTGSGNDFIKGADAKVAMTISTGDGNDVIETGVALTKTLTIDAGAGSDTVVLTAGKAAAVKAAVTLGDGVDTITVDDADALITVADFVAGSGGDKFDLATNNASAAGAATVAYAEGDFTGAGALVAGMNVETSGNLSALTAAGLSMFYGDTDGATADGTAVMGGAATDVAYVVATDGSDAGVFKVADANGDGKIVATEVGLIATLTGVTTLTDFNADNFADFL